MPNKTKKIRNHKIYSVPNYLPDRFENDPLFVKKTEEARAFLKKVGFPKELAEEFKDFR
jgi:hypothetical protein